jgi:hypothetical protein
MIRITDRIYESARSFVGLILLSALLTGCGTLSKGPDCPPVSNANANQASIIGEIEWVSIEPESIRQKARIDTGAQTTSIGVIAQQKYERDGEDWIAFTIKNRQTGEETELKRRITRIVQIKRHNAPSVERYVVKLDLKLGSLSQATEVSLADREQFEFPVLIGRNFLDGMASVDVSKKFTALEKTKTN